MLIIDTNVYSELMRPEPNANVAEWFKKKPASALFITSVSVAETNYGLNLLDGGKRKNVLTTAWELILEETFGNRILSFTVSDAENFADIAAHKRKNGKSMNYFDAQIAAIAKSHDAVLATRNIKDFQDCGIQLVNPFE